MRSFTTGPARSVLDEQTAASLTSAGTLVADSRRRRPLYFDGRFLTATDLTAEQQYFLARQSDLGRAAGMGVVHGLAVRRTGARVVEIAAGHGVTPSGELVLIKDTRPVDLAQIEDQQRLDASFGLSRLPREVPRQRSGIFVLGLRPVEFSANPIASYPTTLDGSRTVHDADIVEATAITLVPYGDAGAEGELDARRSAIARDIFVSGAPSALPANVLPIAMLGLDRGVIHWVDMHLVRREIGREHGDVLGLGFAPRAVREAHMLQYHEQLEQVVRERRDGNRSMQFAASEYFAALPAAGRMPAAAVNPRDFAQVWFPPEVECELSVLADDEVPALLEESLLLPPIDLTGQQDDLDSTDILIVVPVPRAVLRRLQATLGSLRRTLRAAAPGSIAKRRPIELLSVLAREPLVRSPDGQELTDAAWRTVLARAELLWYVRRRNISFKASITGTALRLSGDELAAEEAFLTRLKALRLFSRYQRLENRASSDAAAEMVALLSSPRFDEETTGSRLALDGALAELEGLDAVNRAAVATIVERFSIPGIPDGLVRLEKSFEDFGKAEAVKTIAAASRVPEMAANAQRSTDEVLLKFGDELLKAALEGDEQGVREIVQRWSEA